VAVPADAPRGLREVRAVGRYGISSPKSFVVGDAPEIIDPGTNHTRETAVVLTAPGVAEGRFEAEQRDFYKVTLTKDIAVLLTCHSCALDSLGDPVITVLDSTGKTIGRGDDERDRDAVLSFVPPTDGEYTIAVHDKIFAGGAQYLYRLAIGEPPLRCAIPEARATLRSASRRQSPSRSRTIRPPRRSRLKSPRMSGARSTRIGSWSKARPHMLCGSTSSQSAPTRNRTPC
jgi:hypothetical protein